MMRAARRVGEPGGQDAAARAGRALAAAFAGDATGPRARLGVVEKVGDGTSREIFAADVASPSGSTWAHRRVAVLLPREGGDSALEARTRREARMLEFLAGEALPFRTPLSFGVYPDPKGLALVRSFETGLELELGARARARASPWATVAAIAAAIHDLAAPKLAWLEPPFPHRRALALAVVRPLDGVGAPELADARAWMVEHLPPSTPCVLIHGDLHGANILLGAERPDAVIDWEYAQLGDPAFDLAVVTRGRRRPFLVERGLERLLDAYAQSAACGVERAYVHFYELVLAANWYRQALHVGGAAGAARQLRFLRGVLRRAEASP